jgi:hypothetical protein
MANPNPATARPVSAPAAPRPVAAPVASLTAPASRPTQAADPRKGMPSRVRGIATTQASNQNAWLRPGDYLVHLSRVGEGVTREPAFTPFFVIEGKIIANNPNGPAEQNQVGHGATNMTMLNRDGSLRTVRAFLEAVCTPEERPMIDGDTADETITGWLDSNHFAGRYMLAHAENILTRAGKTFTKVTWFPAPAETVAAALNPPPPAAT